jgi:hypothetical protein
MNPALKEKLARLTSRHKPEPILSDADAVVTHVEVNAHHGVGVLIDRLFGSDPNIVSVRSRDLYEGRQEFGALRLNVAHPVPSRDQVLWNMLAALRGSTVKRILCVPYFPDDALNAIALKDLFGVPLCTYMMDDQNVHIEGIPDGLMGELLEKSSLRLAISRDMAEAYRRKYGREMWLMPPVVPDQLILRECNAGRAAHGKRGVILGNIWGQRWVELLRATVRGSGIALDWHNHGEFRWLPCSFADLASDGIFAREQDEPDETMVQTLRAAPFVVLPSGVLDETDDRSAIARLSFPSRIPYILAASHTPIIVLGSPETAAARFVLKAGIGVAAPYERGAFLQAVERVLEPAANRAFREAAFEIGPHYSDRGAAAWIWESLRCGAPADARFQYLLA